MIPPTRAGRRQLILDILGRQSVHSQGELLEILARDGFVVTQATLSRDLVELGAVKVRQGKALVYAVPGEGGDRTVRAAPGLQEVTSRLRRQCEELLVTAQASANLVILRTPAGAANYLASALDHAGEPDILGTIAGDDTVMIITSGARQSRALASRLLALAGREPAEQTPEPHPAATPKATDPTIASDPTSATDPTVATDPTSRHTDDDSNVVHTRATSPRSTP